MALSEKIFLLAGALTILSLPFLGIFGFAPWLAVKIIYLTGLITLFYVRR